MFGIDVLRDLLPELWSAREPTAQSCDERFIPLAGLGASGLSGRLGKRRRRGQPEADEDGQGLDGDTDIAFHPGHAPVELVEPLGDRSLLALGGVGLEEGCDAGLCNQ